ncbi:uncharacterized protein EV422DRAFT_578767 [Fimicolochytrium jonesii]|uniref:uncharacterized protein n=1 Tax=Fimicolochytrium jonesii TaxID=1396493 RepID=UPI0022FEE5A6|nr:uncharacterized protein EV422DRAFT_578767 [Fimicolochytrium jonesii]KAI8820435.1 hypothetical protein EV422DRAFT_578767 [Fimicolochytrium jonesii]
MKAAAVILGLACATGAQAAPFFKLGRQVAAVSSAVDAVVTPVANAVTQAATAVQAAVTNVVGVQTIFDTRIVPVVQQTAVPVAASVAVTREVLATTVVDVNVPIPTFFTSQVAVPTVIIEPGAPLIQPTSTLEVQYGVVTRYTQTVYPTVITQYITEQVPYTVQTTQTVEVPATVVVPQVLTISSEILVPTVVPGTIVEARPSQTLVATQVVEISAVAPAPPAPTPAV